MFNAYLSGCLSGFVIVAIYLWLFYILQRIFVYTVYNHTKM